MKSISYKTKINVHDDYDQSAWSPHNNRTSLVPLTSWLKEAFYLWTDVFLNIATAHTRPIIIPEKGEGGFF